MKIIAPVKKKDTISPKPGREICRGAHGAHDVMNDPFGKATGPRVTICQFEFLSSSSIITCMASDIGPS